MKKLLLGFLSLLFVLQMASGIPKVAVLDASLGSGVDINAAAIVADTLNEQFVKSEDFIAIDRAYISKIQAEKKFQLSGDVKSDDIKELGATFGAKFLCIANVSQLGSTYTVSARLIEVETAQVVSQESARKQGQIDVLFNVAEEVGSKLIGKDYINSETSQTVVEETAPVVKQEELKTISKKANKNKPHFTIGYMFSGYMGDNGYDDGESFAIYEQDDYQLDNSASSAKLTTWGIDFHLLMPINYKFLYWSLGASYTNQSMDAENNDHDNFYWELFSTIDVTVGIGAIYPIGSSFQLYGGLNLGYLGLVIGSNYGDYATDSYWSSLPGESAGGFMLGIELGADYFIGNFCISAKYKLSRSGDLTGTEIFTDEYEEDGGDTSLGVHGLVLGVGFTW